MIRISMTRKKDGQHYDQGSRMEEPMSALRTLVRAEFAFGGKVVEATGTRLTIVTEVLSNVDTTIFEGTAEEMAVLNQTVYFYLQACLEKDTVMEGVLADLARIPDGKGGVPLIINLAAPMLMGRNRLALATMMALGITEESDIAAGMLMGMDNLLAAYQLMQEFPGMSLAEMSAATAVDKAA